MSLICLEIIPYNDIKMMLQSAVAVPKTVGIQISSSTQTSPESSKETVVGNKDKDTTVPSTDVHEETSMTSLTNGGDDSLIPKSPSKHHSHRSSRKSERSSRARSPTSGSSSNKFGSTGRRRGEDKQVPVKEAMSPSVAESIRSGKNFVSVGISIRLL